MLSNNFSNRLEILIKENKTKKKDLAKAIGLSASTITDMVKGRNNSTIPTIRAIANYYHVNESWLAYGTLPIMEPITTEPSTPGTWQLSAAEAEAIKIMRECPEALSVVRMMGAVDSDTQEDIRRIAETEKRAFEKFQELRKLKSA